jgi:mannose-6-phosphate isomerase-like protein (cupin superfamily)
MRAILRCLLLASCAGRVVVAQSTAQSTARSAPSELPVIPRAQRLEAIPAAVIEARKAQAIKLKAQGVTMMTAADEQTHYLIVVRTVVGDVERHARWDDIVVVRAGHGTITTGRGIAGGRALAPGEWRGGTLVTPMALALGPGDVARVPAGAAHVFAPSGTEPFEYLLIRVRRGAPVKRASAASPQQTTWK